VVPDESIAGMQANLKWQDAVGVVGLMAGFGGMNDLPIAVRVLCFAACAICFCISFYSHKDWWLSLRWILSGCVSLLMIGLIYRLVTAKEIHIPSAQENGAATAEALRKQDNAKTAVELECEQDGLPIHVPPNESAHVVVLNKKLVTSQRWGLYEIENPSTIQITWPDKRLLDESRRKHNPGVFIYRCVASNEGSTKLLNVSLMFNLNFSTAQTFPYQVIANPLDPAQKFTSYFVNICPVGAFVTAQRAYSAQILGENERRSYPLLLPNRSPVQENMIFFPSSVRWAEDPCE
jgi:hypothetical protein